MLTDKRDEAKSRFLTVVRTRLKKKKNPKYINFKLIFAPTLTCIGSLS